ncbi:MAG: hypothetical protein L3K24_03930 [Gammaproteobacteria bacterium]|nr:hypothetical protein [Gammaproteobacteria bacterium]
MRPEIIYKTPLASISGGIFFAGIGLIFSSTQVSAATIEQISIANDGTQVTAIATEQKAISTDGRYVVFSAQGLTPGDTHYHAYLRDRATNTIEMVSIASDGSHSVSLSNGSVDVTANGRYVTFVANWPQDGSTSGTDVYVRDRITNTTELISSPGEAGKNSQDTSISDNGRYVVFSSSATNLVSDDTNGSSDIFVRDRVTGTMERVSIASNGTEAHGGGANGSRRTAISGDGRYVAFISAANNLVANDTNGVDDLFLHDRATGTTQRINVANDGTQASVPFPNLTAFALSGDGRYLVFPSIEPLSAEDTNNQVDIYVYDQVSSSVELVSKAYDGSSANSVSFFPGISGNGRYVSFISVASNIIEGGIPQSIGAFVYDRVTQTTEMVDVPDDGVSVADSLSFGHTGLSGDGRHVIFSSAASNLVTGVSDTNNTWDVFVRDRLGGICP